jgi:aminopeptidase N
MLRKSPLMILSILFLLPATQVAAQQCHYSLALSVDVKDSSIRGIETIAVVGKTNSVFRNLMLEGLTIDNIRTNGHTVNYHLDNGKLVLDTTGLSKIAISYHGTPHTGLKIRHDELYTGFHTEGWMVCDPRPSTKATFDLTLTLSSVLKPIASGTLIGQSEQSNMITYRYRQSIPISAYVFGFAAGHFTESRLKVHGRTLRVLSAEFSKDQRDSVLRITSGALEYFEKITGKKYPYDSYTQVFTEDDNEQEVAGFSLLSIEYLKSVLKEPREDWLIIHELAHQWFGNSITCASWSDFWLNEGMVTFLTAAYKETESGRDEYDREIFLARSRYSKVRGTAKDRPIVSDNWKKPEDMSGIITYYKGALVLNYLKYQLGDKVFWASLKYYVKKHWNSTVSTSEFKSDCETISHKSLAAFFDQWVYGSSYSNIKVEYDGEGDSVILTFAQDSLPQSLPMSIAIEDLHHRLSHKIIADRKFQRIPFPARDSVLSVRVDDGGMLPFAINVDLPVAMLFYQAQHEPDVIGRIEAISRLRDKVLLMNSIERSTYRTKLSTLSMDDESRMVKMVAAKYLSEFDSKHE